VPLLDRGAKAVGIDISKEDIKKAKQYLRANKFSPSLCRVADAGSLPFPSNTFDLVLISDVIEHVGNPDKVVQEALRVAKKNGRVYVTVPNKWHPVVRYSFVRKLLTGRKNVDEFPDKPYDLKMLIKLFPKTKLLENKLTAFFTEIFAAFQKI
jgi:ubiquinone/menaquinone biosynthesis C-methylase UbiE